MRQQLSCRYVHTDLSCFVNKPEGHKTNHDLQALIAKALVVFRSFNKIMVMALMLFFAGE